MITPRIAPPLPEETDLLDEVAKELFARRLFNIRDISEPEIQKIATECYVKALCFIRARREFLETVRVKEQKKAK